MPSFSLPTSISSTVPLKTSWVMSAMLVSAVPAWNDVSGTTGSPSFTSSSSTVPDTGARMIDSTVICDVRTRPFSTRASRSWASPRRICASWISFSAWSESWLETMPCRPSSAVRSERFLAWS